MRTAGCWTWALAAAVAAAAPARAQESQATVAILAFENSGSYGQDKENFQALQLGIPATLGSALARHPAVRLVPRDRLAQAVQAQSLRPDQRVDAASAGEIGKRSGARYVITGSFADFYGKFRINARVVDARTGEILKVISNDDPKQQDRAQLGAIIQSLSQKLIAAIGLPPAGSGPEGAIPTDAITLYSRGLLYESQGDRAKAGDAFQRALGAYPDYEDAREGLRRVRGS
jgi:TolB-like protein